MRASSYLPPDSKEPPELSLGLVGLPAFFGIDGEVLLVVQAASASRIGRVGLGLQQLIRVVGEHLLSSAARFLAQRGQRRVVGIRLAGERPRLGFILRAYRNGLAPFMRPPR